MTTTRAGTFHSSGLAREVDQLMDILYAGGVNNPMDSIEQISYLLFLRLLWQRDEDGRSIDPNHQGIFSGEWKQYEWGRIATLTGDDLFNTLRSAIEQFDQLPGLTETGRLLFRQSTLKILDRPTLRAIVQGVHQLHIDAEGTKDPKGDMYEYLLGKIATSGTNGQFRTPRHIIDMIVQLVDPQAGERICDPAAGTAGFLLAANDHILRNNTSHADLDRGEVTGDLLEPGDDGCQDLHHDAGGDVGIHPKRDDGEVPQAAPREQVEESDQVVVLEEGTKLGTVDSRHGHVG